jgi:hypothetical protein
MRFARATIPHTHSTHWRNALKRSIAPKSAYPAAASTSMEMPAMFILRRLKYNDDRMSVLCFFHAGKQMPLQHVLLQRKSKC